MVSTKQVKMVVNVDKLWQKKRTYTLMAYMIQYITIGFEKSSTGITLWMYLTTMIKNDNPELFFGVINLVYFVPSLFCSMFVARLADKTRRTKLIVIICNFISMIGCIIYVIPKSPYYPLIGQILLGLNLPITRPITSAEIARSYPGDETEKKLPLLMVAFFIGYSIGPIVIGFGQYSRFSIFGIPITMCNIAGFITFILFIFTQICNLFLVTDLSSEYDLKEATSKENNKFQSYEKETSWNVLKKVVKTFDVLFVMFMTALAAVSRLAFDRSFPVIVSELSLPYYFLAIFNISHSVMLIGIVAVLTVSKHTHQTVYICGVFSVLFLLIAGTFQMLLIKTQLSFPSAITVTLLLSVCITIVETGEQFFLLTVSTKMVSSQHQAFVESIRGVSRGFGSILGSLVSGYLVKYCYTFSIGLTLSCLLQLVVLIVRREIYKNPKILI